MMLLLHDAKAVALILYLAVLYYFIHQQIVKKHF